MDDFDDFDARETLPLVKNTLSIWYDWLLNYVLPPGKRKGSSTLRDQKMMSLFK